MANLVADKGMDGQTWVIESTDTPIMTWNQVQGSTPNASEVNGTTIAPVPVGKQLVITNCIMLATSTADVQIFNSASSGSATGTQLGQNYIEADEETSNVNIPVYWTLAAGRYLVVKEGSAGANCQSYCRGFLQDV